MDQTTWVIKVLDDARNKSIEYRNRVWLQKNVERLNICVCVECSTVNTFGIADAWGKKGTMLIQNGEYVQFKDDFHPGKEALLLTKYEERYLVCLYFPKE